MLSRDRWARGCLLASSAPGGRACKFKGPHFRLFVSFVRRELKSGALIGPDQKSDAVQ